MSFALSHSMQLHVEWNAERSDGNVRVNGVSFGEAATVLGDPMSRTVADGLHPADSARFVTLGLSHHARMLVVSHVDRGRAIWILGARRAMRSNETPARSTHRSPGARDEAQSGEYDFSAGARGKYAARYWQAAAAGNLRRV